jgi:hypothetical protein
MAIQCVICSDVVRQIVGLEMSKTLIFPPFKMRPLRFLETSGSNWQHHSRIPEERNLGYATAKRSKLVWLILLKVEICAVVGH